MPKKNFLKTKDVNLIEMEAEERLIGLSDRLHHLELLDELDRQAAKTERESRTARKREINAERKTIRVRQEGALYVLAEDITDPIKWNALIRAGLLYRLPGNVWGVRVIAASSQGYDVVEMAP